jgi:hypothetical protein
MSTETSPEYLTLRLIDLKPHEQIEVRCECGRIVHYPPGFLQRRARLSSLTLIYDLQYRLRCQSCNRRDGFAISIIDRRDINDPSRPRLERVIVGKRK